MYITKYKDFYNAKDNSDEYHVLYDVESDGNYSTVCYTETLEDAKNFIDFSRANACAGAPLVRRSCREAEVNLANEIEHLCAQGHIVHHWPSEVGHLYRTDTRTRKRRYKGRFGEGFILAVPSRESSRYHDVVYIVKED